jgi:hypothetical protein
VAGRGRQPGFFTRKEELFFFCKKEAKNFYLFGFRIWGVTFALLAALAARLIPPVQIGGWDERQRSG